MDAETVPGDGRFTVDGRACPLSLVPGARRIVSLAPSCTDSVIAIGAGDRRAGVDEHVELPLAFAHVERVGGATGGSASLR